MFATNKKKTFISAFKIVGNYSTMMMNGNWSTTNQLSLSGIAIVWEIQGIFLKLVQIEELLYKYETSANVLQTIRGTENAEKQIL